jgi:ABC-type sugar transport system ATPase subunit
MTWERMSRAEKNMMSDLRLHARLQEQEIERLRAENDVLRGLVRDAPIILIDESAAEVRGEEKLVAYIQAVREWTPKAKAALDGQLKEGS